MMHSHDQNPSAVTKANAESQPGPNPIIRKTARRGVPSSSLPKVHLLKSGLEKEVKKMFSFLLYILSFSEQFRNYEMLIIIKAAGREALIPNPGYHDQQG